MNQSGIFAKVAVCGPVSSGKTTAALQLAHGLVSAWDKIVLLDATGQGLKVIHQASFGPLKLDPLKGDGEYVGPAAWITALRRAADSGAEAVVIDTASDEWDWCLQQKDKLGGGFPVWKQITPEHNRFIRAIMRCPLHVVSVLRRKEKFRMSADAGKKGEVVSLGMRSEMRSGFERGMDLVIGLDVGFLARVEHDRTGQFQKGGSPIVPREVGLKLRAWVKGEMNGKPE